MMESWRKVWREGIVPQLTMEGLQSLKEALQRDDPRLVQGATTTPPPLLCVRDWPCEAACLIGWCGAERYGGLLPYPTFSETVAYDGQKAREVATVGQVEEYFARACHECDQAINEPAGVRWLLNWFDETPRDEMIAQLLPEVEWALKTKE